MNTFVVRHALTIAVGLCSLAVGARGQVFTIQPGSIGRESTAVRFAIIGDYGVDTPEEASVARLVDSLRPHFVLTLGDNNYPAGDAAQIDAHIGQYYSKWIGNYAGTFGAGSATNRFFPSLGNHDWVLANAAAYLNYFTLPGNERYYDFVRGPVHFYALDSDPHEPDGITSTSVQAAWLQAKLASATEPFQVVYFHHPPYSSASHGNTPELQWPFRQWGADVVLSGHDHSYERVVIDGFPYLVNGLGGAPKYGFNAPVAGSTVRFDGDHGALIVDATEKLMTLDFVSRADVVIDRFALPRDTVAPQTTTFVASGSTWAYRDNDVAPASNWKLASFDDSTWSQGAAQLGYGDGDETTLVSYGPNPNQKYATTWFRRTFQVSDPSVITDLSLQLLCDDGAVVYLNGVEIVRSNLAPGATFATLAIAGVDESAFTATAIAPSAIATGTNVLAVEVHQFSATSPDVSFDLRLTGHTIGTRLVAAGSTWKYRDNGVAPDAAWASTAFDDSAWASGPAQLGYGDGDEATVVSYGTNPNQKFVTTWFRRAFTLQQTPAFRAALLRLVRDDGVVVYLNGSEVFRQNLPRVGLGAASLAAYAVSGTDETAFVETFVDASRLHAGVNVLAIEMHQATTASSDLSFDLELIGL